MTHIDAKSLSLAQSGVRLIQFIGKALQVKKAIEAAIESKIIYAKPMLVSAKAYNRSPYNCERYLFSYIKTSFFQVEITHFTAPVQKTQLSIPFPKGNNEYFKMQAIFVLSALLPVAAAQCEFELHKIRTKL